MRKYVLDTNCYIDASRDAAAHQALETFVAWAAPGLYASSVVAAELREGARSARGGKTSLASEHPRRDVSGGPLPAVIRLPRAPTMTDPEQPDQPTITPVVAWFSAHGVKVLAALIVVELLFHAYAISNRTMP